MTTKLKLALAGALVLGGVAAGIGSAAAMPSGVDPALATQSDLQHGIQKARWACGYWGCRWVPWGYGWGRPWGYGYGYGWRRPWGYGYGGWGWHRWHRW